MEMTKVGMMPLKSPCRIVALQLANTNPLFRLLTISLFVYTLTLYCFLYREKLKKKLLESGSFNFSIDDLNKHSVGEVVDMSIPQNASSSSSSSMSGKKVTISPHIIALSSNTEKKDHRDVLIDNDKSTEIYNDGDIESKSDKNTAQKRSTIVGKYVEIDRLLSKSSAV